MRDLDEIIFDTFAVVLKDYPEFKITDFYLSIDHNYKKGPYAYIVSIKYMPTGSVIEFDLYCEYCIDLYQSFNEILKDKLTKSFAQCMACFMPFEQWEGSIS